MKLFLIENDSFREKRKALFNSSPVKMYRGLGEGGKNFYKGDVPLPFKYFALNKLTAEKYGKVSEYIFNCEGRDVKIFRGRDMFNTFGLGWNVEKPEIIAKLVEWGYSGVLIGDQLIIYDFSLICED